MDEVTISPGDNVLVPIGLLDQNPAAVYLATLRPVGRLGMHSALNRVAEMISGGKHTALTLPWHQLRYQHTAAIRSMLIEKGFRPATINQSLSGLRSVLYHTWKLGLMTTDDYLRTKDVKDVRAFTLPRGRALSKDEIIRLVQTCKNDSSSAGVRDVALVTLLYGTGLRRSEVVKLKLKDYNPETGALKIIDAKGGKDRIVYVKGGAAKALANWLALRGNTPGALFCPVHKAGKVRIEEMSDESIRKFLIKRGKQAGLEAFSAHDFRRTFISDLLDAGADIVTIQKLAGHANVTTTARYDRRGEEAKSKAAELLDIPFYEK